MHILLVLCALPALSLAALVGGLKNVTLNVDDPNVMFALSAINDFYKKQGDTDVRQLVQIEKAQSQVVAGTLYYLTLRVLGGSEEELCEVTVWSRPWLSTAEATQITDGPACKPVVTGTSKMPLLGGEVAADPMSKEVQAALNFATTTLNAMENYLYLRKPIKIAKVTTQVVSGIMYHFYDVEMAATNCRKDGTKHILSSCDINPTGNVELCSFNVWWQSWMNPEYQLQNDFHCKII